MQAHPHTSCHPLRHENLPATRSSSKLPASTHAVLTESRASDQEEESAFSTSSGTIFLHTDYKGFADSILLNALLGSFFDTYKK